MKIDRNLIKYVGKEVANLDAVNVLGVAQGFDGCTVYDNLEEKILQIRPRDLQVWNVQKQFDSNPKED